MHQELACPYSGQECRGVMKVLQGTPKLEELEWCWRYAGWIFSGGKCEGLLGYLLEVELLENLRRVQDEESERAMGRPGRESEHSEVPVPGDSESHGTSDWGIRERPRLGSGGRSGFSRSVVSDWSETEADPGLAVGSGDRQAGLTWAGCPGSA